MPFPGTPSPFRLSRRQSTRRGPQFATSPRFLLSQPPNDVDILDDDDFTSTAPVASTSASRRNAIPPRWKKDVIEDYDEDELPRNISTQRRGELADDAIESSQPEAPATPGLVNQEEETVFASIEDGNKRRRVLGQSSLTQKLREDLDHTSSPEVLNQAAQESPAPQSRPGFQHPNVHATPVPSRTMGIGTSTPGPASTPFRSKPRFMLSGGKPPSSLPISGTQTPAPSQSSTPLEKRKPAFVLPRSPSPKPTKEDIPAPFSPSSRALRRRGKPRAGDSNYMPGGMAADVRGWILEMGSKREQALQTRLLQVSSEDRASQMSSRYLVAARVVSVDNGMLSSSGPLAFIKAEAVNDSAEEDAKVLNILALGPPRSKPRTSSRSIPFYIQPGDLLGFHRGLAWYIDLHGPQACPSAAELQTIWSQVDGAENSNERWLVAMEWDLVQEAT
ncbi:hypothetical protein N7490_011753 [Penicillium lividum]|nr:hypothetical protein N7490_011753 [Penicillium lividum]